tara:strand:- start:446 stop:2194 length:1749 start_codon:yes stop_codon:yes gene_type:complete
MASDANLIKGAGYAYGAGAKAKAMAGSELAKLGQNMTARIDQDTSEKKEKIAILEEQKRQSINNLYDAADKLNESSSNLSEKHYQATQNAIEGLKKQHNQCKLGDEACRRDKMAQMSKMTNVMNNQKDLRKTHQSVLDNKLLTNGLKPGELDIMTAYLNPDASDYELSYEKIGGEATYNIDVQVPDPENPGKMITEKKSYTESQIAKLFDRQKDNISSKEIKDYGVSLIEQGQNGDTYEPTKQTAKYNGMINENNLESFTHDDLGMGSFIEDFKQPGGPVDQGLISILQKNPNMSQLGISPKAGEENWYETIDEEDRAAMINALTNDNSEENPFYNPKLHKEVVVDYYEKMSKKQHDAGIAAAEKAALAKQNETISKMKFKQFETQLKMAIDNNASANDINELISKYQLEAGKETTETSQQVVPAAKNVTVENVNYKEGKDDPGTASMEVSTDRLRGIKKELDDPNTRGLVGYQGYYYKDGENNYRKFDNKQDFIKKQKIKIKDGETEDQAIARFNAKKNKGLVGGKATSYETIYSDEQLSSAEDTIIDKTSTSKTKNSAIGTDTKGNPILVEPKVASADNL